MLLQAAIYISLRGYTLRQINMKQRVSPSSLNHTLPLPAPIPPNEEGDVTAGAGQDRPRLGIFLKTDGHGEPREGPARTLGWVDGPTGRSPPAPRSPAPLPACSLMKNVQIMNGCCLQK